MKSDLRKYIPATDEQLRRFDKAMAEESTYGVSEECLSRLMGGVKAARRLEKFRNGEDTPASLRVLVDTLCQAHGISELDVLKVVSVGKGTWLKALSGRSEPYRIAAGKYARMAERYGIGFSALRQAILGSYSLFMRQHLDTHVRFARSSKRTRRTGEFPAQMSAAYEELRTKSAAHRQALAGSGAIDTFLSELQQCMS